MICSAASADLSTLLSLDPDVVIVGDDPTGLVGRLNAAGVPSYSGAPPASLADVYTQIVDIASIVGRPDAGEELVASMQADIAAIVGAVPPGQRTYFHEIDPSLVTITPGSFLDSVYAQLGLVSIVGVADPSGVAQLSSEQVVAANPAVILLADAECCDVTIDRIASRPGWAVDLGGERRRRGGATRRPDDALGPTCGRVRAHRCRRGRSRRLNDHVGLADHARRPQVERPVAIGRRRTYHYVQSTPRGGAVR